MAVLIQYQYFEYDHQEVIIYDSEGGRNNRYLDITGG